MATINVKKEWAGDSGFESFRPNEVSVGIVDDRNRVIDTLVLNENNNWEAEYTEMGSLTDYGVEEITQIPNYRTTYETTPTGNNWNRGYDVVITNTLEVTPTLNYEVNISFKGDVGNEDFRPNSIEVVLFRDNQEYATQNVHIVNGTGHASWSNLQTNHAYRAEAQEISSYIKEESTSSQSGRMITNVEYTFDYSSLIRNIVAEAAFVGDGKHLEERPKLVEFQLFADDVLDSSVRVQQSNNYTWTWANKAISRNWSLQCPTDAVNYKKTISEFDESNGDKLFVVTFTYDESSPEPIGPHPTKSDNDLKYSFLYDSLSVKNFLDIKNILDTGVHLE